MNLEYLKNGSEDCPLIRLYEFNRSDIQGLRAEVIRLMDGTVSRIDLEEIVPVTSIDGVKLAFVREKSDQGVVCVGKNAFEVVLSNKGWERVLDCLEPFLEPSSGYQWLCEKGDANLLLSSDGAW